MMRQAARAAVLLSVGFLAGCAESLWADDALIEAAAYQPDQPASVTLMTMISTRTGEGGHSALLVDGTHRTLYDPAGTWFHEWIPERNDVLHGMSQPYMDLYYDFHARPTYFVVLQKLEVSLETADAVAEAAQAFGAAPNAHCAFYISGVLNQFPEFEEVGRRVFPVRMMRAFEALEGVETTRIYDDDRDRETPLRYETGPLPAS